MSDEIDASSEALGEEVVDRAETYYRGIEFTGEEYEAVMESIDDFAAIAGAGRAYFVLGNYGDDEKDRLNRVKGTLDGRPGAYAFLMDDVARPWKQTYAKFRLLGDLTDAIVGVAEHRSGGFRVEQGYFTAIEPYFRHTYVCRLEYPNDGVRDADHEFPYSWMQEGVFELLDAEGRLGENYYRQLRDHRYAEEVVTDRGDEAIVAGYDEYQDENRKNVLLFSNDRDFIERAKSHRILAQRVEFSKELSRTVERPWTAVQDTLYMLTVLFGVIELPKVTLYGVWKGKEGLAWQEERLNVDCRSPKVEPLIERDLRILNAG